MAERRMFAKTIIDSDAFIDMPVTARLLYYDLGMRADDDGFVNSPKKIMRMVGSSQDDLSILISKKFIIPFDSGVVVIKHWRIHNYIRKDTYHETKYKEEKAMLTMDENDSYSLNVTSPLQMRDESVTVPSTQVRLGKDRLGKDSKDSSDRKRFTKPSIEELEAYIAEKNLNVDAEKFMDYYESNGWRVGRNPMKDWKATVRRWNSTQKQSTHNVEMPDYMSDGYHYESKKASSDLLAKVKAKQEAMK